MMSTNQRAIESHTANEIKMFMEKGGRNTSAMGKALCERLNELELMHDIPVSDCDAIYE